MLVDELTHKKCRRKHCETQCGKRTGREEASCEGATQGSVAEKCRISQSQVSRWIVKRKEIMKYAASKHRKPFKKGRKPEKYIELYEKLWVKFKAARSKGHRVNLHWVWTIARVLYREITGCDESVIKSHVVVRFLRQYNNKMRARQRNKNKRKEDKVPDLQKWHASYRERCVRFRKDDSFDTKWGRFKPHERLNVDQSPLPFVIEAKRTYEYVEPGAKDHNTWISQPGSGLDKRQCSLQVMFRPEGTQPRLAIIFRGKGKNISLDEKLAWHPNVDFFFKKMPGWTPTFVYNGRKKS